MAEFLPHTGVNSPFVLVVGNVKHVVGIVDQVCPFIVVQTGLPRVGVFVHVRSPVLEPVLLPVSHFKTYTHDVAEPPVVEFLPGCTAGPA